MKKLLILLLVFIFSISIQAQSHKERKAQKKAELEAKYEETKSLIDSKNYEFVAQWADPLGNDVIRIGQNLLGAAGVFQGNRIDLTGNPNFVKIIKSEVSIFLPFFGRVFYPKRTNTEGGFKYEGRIDDYLVSMNENKKVLTVKFNTKTKDDHLQFILRITAGGAARLNVNSINRQTISYDGSIRASKQVNNN